MSRIEAPLIAVIEDDDSVRQSLKLTLDLLGYRVTAFIDGHSALKEMKNLRANAVIIDYALPGMNGIDILRNLRRDPHYARVPTLMLTAFERDGFREEVLDEGFVDFLQKPFEIKQLEKALEILIRYQKTAEVLDCGPSGNRRRKVLPKSVQEKYNLTAKEFEVVSLLFKGMSTDEIIVQMNIKRNTHKNHMSRILKKVNVRNQTELLQACYTTT